MDSDHARGTKGDAELLDKNMDAKKLKDSYLLLKQKMCKTHELIQRYNDKLKECEALKTDRDALKKEVRKVTYNYNTTLAKNIKLEHQNAEYKKNNENAIKTVTEYELKVAGDQQLIKQLTCKMNDLEEKHSQKVLELDLDRSGLKEKIKDLEQELRAVKKSTVTKMKKMDKKGDNLKSNALLLEQMLSDAKTTVDAAVNTTHDLDPPKLVFSEKCLMTDEFYSLKDNPYPVFCAKCELLITPPPIDKICKVMTSCPSLLEKLSPPRPITPDKPHTNEENNIDPQMNEKQGVKRTSNIPDSLNVTKENHLIHQEMPLCSTTSTDTNVTITNSESTLSMIKELHKKVTTLESKIKKQSRRKMDIQSTCCQNAHQHCNNFIAKDTVNVPFYPPLTPDIWRMMMNANNPVEHGKRRKKDVKENERKLRKPTMKKVKLKNKKKIKKYPSDTWSVEHIMQNSQIGSYTKNNKKIKNIKCSKKDKKNFVLKNHVCHNSNVRTSTSDLSADEGDHMDVLQENVELADDVNDISSKGSPLQFTETEMAETTVASHFSNVECNEDVRSRVKKNLLPQLEEQEKLAKPYNPPCLNTAEEIEVVGKMDKEPLSNTNVEKNPTCNYTLNESNNCIPYEKVVQCENLQNVEATDSNRSPKSQVLELPTSVLSESPILSTAERCRKRKKLSHISRDEKHSEYPKTANELSETYVNPNEICGNSNENPSPANILLTNPNEQSSTVTGVNQQSESNTDDRICSELTDTHEFKALESDLNITPHSVESATQYSPENNSVSDIKLAEPPKRKRGRPPKASSASRGALLKKLRQLRKDQSTVQPSRLISNDPTENIYTESHVIGDEDNASEDCHSNKKRRIAHTVRPYDNMDRAVVVLSRTLRSHNEKTSESQCDVQTVAPVARNRRQTVVKNTASVVENSSLLNNCEVEHCAASEIERELHSSIISEDNIENKKSIDKKVLRVSLKMLQSSKENTEEVESCVSMTDDVDAGNPTRPRKRPTRSANKDVNVSERISTEQKAVRNDSKEEYAPGRLNLSKEKEINFPKKGTSAGRGRKKVPIRRSSRLVVEKDDCIVSQGDGAQENQDGQTLIGETKSSDMHSDVIKDIDELKSSLKSHSTSAVPDFKDEQNVIRSTKCKDLDRTSPVLNTKNSFSYGNDSYHMSDCNDKTSSGYSTEIPTVGNQTNDVPKELENTVSPVDNNESKTDSSDDSFRINSTISCDVIENECFTNPVKESKTGISVPKMRVDISAPLDVNRDSRVESSQISSSDLKISNLDISVNRSSAHDDDLSKTSQNVQYKHAIPVKGIDLLTQRRSKICVRKAKDMKTATLDIKFKRSTEIAESKKTTDEHLTVKDSINEIPHKSIHSNIDNFDRINDISDEMASPMSPEYTKGSNDLIVKIIPTTPQKLDTVDYVSQGLLSPMSPETSNARDDIHNIRSIPTCSDISYGCDVDKVQSQEKLNTTVNDRHNVETSFNNENDIIYNCQNGNNRNPVVSNSVNIVSQAKADLTKHVPSNYIDPECSENTDYLSPMQILLKVFKRCPERMHTKELPSELLDRIDLCVTRQLQRVLDNNEWSPAVHKDIVKKLTAVSTPQIIAKNIVEAIMNDTHNKVLDKTFTPPAPLMTKAQQKFLTILLDLEQAKPTVCHFVEEGILYKLFKLNQTPKWCEMERLTRMYVVMARAQKNRKKVRIFCLDALYCLGYKASRLFEIVLTSWPEVLPVCGLQPGIFPKLIVTIIATLQGKDIFVVKKMLAGYYKYPPEGYAINSLLQEFLAALKTTQCDGLDTALLLLAKKGGVSWTYKHIIKDGLLPMIVNGSHPDSYRAFCLLGNLMRAFPQNDPECMVAPIIEQLIDLLESGEGSAAQQEGIASALLSLSRHNFNDTMTAVLNWTPLRALTRRTRDQLQMIISSRTPDFWKGFMRKLEKSKRKKA